MCLVELPKALYGSGTDVNYNAAEEIQNKLYHDYSIEVRIFIICILPISNTYILLVSAILSMHFVQLNIFLVGLSLCTLVCTFCHHPKPCLSFSFLSP